MKLSAMVADIPGCLLYCFAAFFGPRALSFKRCKEIVRIVEGDESNNNNLFEQ